MSNVKLGTVFYQVYQNNREGAENDKKWYARAKHTQTVTFSQMITHMADHNIGIPRGIVAAVMMSFVDCLLEVVAQSKKVQLGDLGTFYLGITTKPADKYEDFTPASNITSCALRFLASQTNENNLSRAAFTSAMQYRNFNTLMTDKDKVLVDNANKALDKKE